MASGALPKNPKGNSNTVIDESWRETDQAFLRQGCYNHQPRQKLRTGRQDGDKYLQAMWV